LKPGTIVSTQQYEALVVDMDAMLPFDPFITAASSSPSLDEIARWIEHHDWRRSHRSLIGLESPRTVEDPGTALCVDGDAGHVSELPLCGHLRPTKGPLRTLAGCDL